MIQITPEIARIHAHICADGYLAKYSVKRSEKELLNHKRRNITRTRYDLRYTAQNSVLRKGFKKDVKKALNRKCSLCSGKRELSLSGKLIYEQFVLLGVGKSRDWFISNPIFDANDMIICQWIRAFFDDEGTVDISRKRVRVKSVNLNGLKQVQRLFEIIGIGSKITGPNCDNTWYITIKDLTNFNNKIGFSEPNKRRKLKNLIRN